MKAINSLFITCSSWLHLAEAPMPAGRNPSYKELTLHQLRSLCETARLGSFVAAAAALDVSHPTVWKQVHALEREFGVKLVEPHGRGCYLTAAGRRLVEMAGPAVEAIATLRERFRAALAEEGAHLTVAVTPRMVVEEMAACVVKFHATSPKTRFSFLEVNDDGVAPAVEARQADFGFTPLALTAEQGRTLLAEPAYTLEVRLITPADHPLARRRHVHPRDLGRYPFVNLPNEFFSSAYIRAVLDRHHAYRVDRHQVHAGYVASVRRFVELGFGIGLVCSAPSAPRNPRLHERSMGRHFGSIVFHLIRRRGAFTPPAGEEFIRLVRDELRPVPRATGKERRPRSRGPRGEADGATSA
jgi:DNA-binding transcriptional LysR family regulator